MKVGYGHNRNPSLGQALDARHSTLNVFLGVMLVDV